MRRTARHHCQSQNDFFLLRHLFFGACLTERQARRPLTKKSKNQKGNSTRKSKVGLAMGPASDLELLKFLGVGPRAPPKAEGPVRLKRKSVLSSG